MMIFRNIVGASILMLAAACGSSADKAPVDAAGQPMEQLVVHTSSGAHPFWVEIADEEPERQKGMMFRTDVPDDQGMLFQFDSVAERSFWMKNTSVSLDIAYLNPSGTIVSIARHTTPMSEAPIASNGGASGVLEVKAGRLDAIGAKPGDRVEHPFFSQ